MTTASSKELRKIWNAARPVIERQMDAAEIVAAMRKNATDKGFDWSQIKALLKAEIQDGRDEKGDGHRVRRLLEKADNATAYADMLGIASEKVNHYIFSDHESEPPNETSAPSNEPAKPDGAGGGGAEGATSPGACCTTSAPSAPNTNTAGPVATVPYETAGENPRPDEQACPAVALNEESGLPHRPDGSAPLSGAPRAAQEEAVDVLKEGVAASSSRFVPAWTDDPHDLTNVPLVLRRTA